MGFSIGDIFRGANALGGDPISSFLASGLLGDKATNWLADPMDLAGERAEQTQEEVSDILSGNTRAGITQQEQQMGLLDKLQGPFRDAALNSAMPNLQSLAFGGEIDYQPSKLFELQSKVGQRGIRRRLAAQGKLDSSQRFEEEGALLQGLAAEDLQRFEQGQLAQLQTGLDSTEALNAAGQTLGGNISNLRSNLGAGLSQASSDYGAQRQSSFQGAANTVGSLAAGSRATNTQTGERAAGSNQDYVTG